MKTQLILFALATTWVTAAHAAPVDLVLRLQERSSIQELAREVTDPSSPRYKIFFTPEEIRAIVAPSDSDYAALVQNLKQRGFEIVRESKSHLNIIVRAEQEKVEDTLGTKLNRVAMRLAGTASAVSIPSDLRLVESITGLDQTRKMHPHYRLSDLAVAAPRSGQKTPKPKTLTPAAVKTAYGFDPIYQGGIDGTGQHIAIATYNGFHLDDVNGFFVQTNISPAPVVDQINFNGTAPMDEDSAVETELDTEFSGMMAPGAQIHVFTSADNSEAGEIALFTAILDDNRAQVVNYSWGSCESQATAASRADLDKVFARAVAQGVNILVASGDSGSEGCSGSTSNVADWPASEPTAVAVGGTSFALDSSGNLAETAWSGTGSQGGSGGGVSSVYKLPAYQSNFQSPYRNRSIPDVSFDADPNSGQQVWTSCQPNKKTGACSHGTAGWMGIGGTSMATPQWTGFLALVGQARANTQKATLGFLNPIIYSMSASDRAQTFHDITSGDNGGYQAGPGWDAVTGWGSMQADSLLNYLSQQ